jgi:hypothetical protein
MATRAMVKRSGGSSGGAAHIHLVSDGSEALDALRLHEHDQLTQGVQIVFAEMKERQEHICVEEQELTRRLQRWSLQSRHTALPTRRSISPVGVKPSSCGRFRIQEVERETGFVTPGTNHRVEILYRLG